MKGRTKKTSQTMKSNEQTKFKKTKWNKREIKKMKNRKYNK